MTSEFTGIRACVFDAYGTLLDFNSAVDREGASLGDRAAAFSALWRTKQLEYTWLRSLMRRHAPFWQVTGEALDFTMASFEVEDAGLRDRLMQAYRTLETYPEVPAMMAALKARGVKTAILSNGSPEMLDDGVEAAGLKPHLDHVLSVEAVGVFKPDPKVYQLATETLGISAKQVGFMSSNCWDVHGASSFGFRCIWVNRAGMPDDRLPGEHETILKDLSPLPGLVGR